MRRKPLFPPVDPATGRRLESKGPDSSTLAQRLKVYAPGLTPRAVRDKLSGIQMIDVKLPTTDGRLLVMPRYTQPEPEHQMLLKHLHLELPPQPPPRMYAAQWASAPNPERLW